jgi:tetratricopeptide (TPR) repeat protein
MTSQWMGDLLTKQEEVLPEHKAFLEMALASYEEFATDTGQDEAARAGVAAAYLRAGTIREKLGLPAEAEHAYVCARQRYTDLLADFPTVAAYRKGLADSHFSFGWVLTNSDRGWTEAERAFRATIPLRQQLVAEFPTDPSHRFNLAFSHARLGLVLEHMNRLREAEQAFRTCLELRTQLVADFPNELFYQLQVAGAGIDLVNVLLNTGREKEAEETVRRAVSVYQRVAAEHPVHRVRLVWAIMRQGDVLKEIGRAQEAEQVYRSALPICQQLLVVFPAYGTVRDYSARIHGRIGDMVSRHGRRLDEAIAAYREAVRLQPDQAKYHYDLGVALHGKGRLEEAIGAFRKAIEIKPDSAKAHCDLGSTLAELGQFAEALTEQRRGHELGRKTPGWSYPSAAWVKQCERLVELDQKLPALLSGEANPADTPERLALAKICQTDAKQLHAAAARWYTEAFAAEPRLAGAQPSRHRYNAACAAALAGCGQGKDAAGLDEKDRARLRLWSLDWLKRELQAWERALEQAPDKAGPAAGKQLQHWLHDADFSGVRGAEALARLPAAERQKWQQLWADVAATLARSQGQAAAEPKAEAK